jgi:hypothetical protein
MNYEWIASPNFQKGRTQPIRYIVIHHWDDPAKKPKIDGVINHFKDPKVQVSAHYIVSGDRVVKMVQEADTAWHAKQANPYTIGIEVDPQVPGNTYKTLAALVRDIRTRHGDLPLKKHSDFNQTSCPGNLDLPRIDKEAQGEDMKLTVGEMDAMKWIATRQKITKPEIEKYQDNLGEFIQYLTRVQSEHGVAPVVLEQYERNRGAGQAATPKQIAAEQAMNKIKEFIQL